MEKELRKEICEFLLKERRLKDERKGILGKIKIFAEQNLVGKCFSLYNIELDKEPSYFLFEEIKEAEEIKELEDFTIFYLSVFSDKRGYGFAEEKEPLISAVNAYAVGDLQEVSYKTFMGQFSITEKNLLDKIHQTCKELQTNTEKQNESK